jgi:hypothetical protein
MERTIGKIKRLEEKIARFNQMQATNAEIDVDDMAPDEIEDEELKEALEVGSKFKYKLAHLDVDRWIEDLAKDKQQLNLLYLAAKDVSIDRDAKLLDLKRLIETKVKNPTTNKLGQPNRKLLVFTAFSDTAVYLHDSLKDSAIKELVIQIALVPGGGYNKTTLGKSDYNQILTNFSPRSKNRDKIPSMPQEGEIDLLIATDCISEGQNLQDCDCLVNYDIHWNPVRVIQRFGRIDRIGSVNHAVQLVNFWPTQDLEKYVNLKNRVEARMALVDIAATFEDNILKTDEIEELIKDELKYRDKQLLRLKDELLDLEDFNETVALNEFTLDDFRIELSKYIEANRQLLENAPLGLYAVVPPHPEHQVISPGVVFCFKQKGNVTSGETVNPLQPYYLVYVLKDSTVRFSFAQPKQILEIYRLLCSDKTAAYEQLCQLFDAETQNGVQMIRYNNLLHAAVKSIARTFQKRVAAGLQMGRDFMIPAQHEQGSKNANFQLISWLVIKAL